jgi:hypothetical protein
MSYSLYNGSEGRCAVDWKAWNTAIDFVANQSVKVKLIRYDDYTQLEKQASDEFSKASQSHYRNPESLDELLRAYEDAVSKTSAPQIFLSIETIDLISGCAGTVDARVQVALKATSILGTDHPLLTPSMEIWRDHTLIKGPFDTFSTLAIQTSEQIMKKLVNDWAKAQED